MSDVILEARGILKRYPGNIALDHVDFKLHRRAVNVLIGENGAGKSTRCEYWPESSAPTKAPLR